VSQQLDVPTVQTKTGGPAEPINKTETNNSHSKDEEIVGVLLLHIGDIEGGIV